MKKLLIAVLSAAAMSAWANGGADTNDYVTLRSGKKMLRSEFRAKMEKGRLRATGGTITKANSGKGRLVVLNAQGKVATDDLVSIRKPIDQYVHVDMSFQDSASLTLSTVGEAIRSSGGTVGVGIVEDAALPSLLAAPETGWALVNVAKLAADNPDAATLLSRVRKEVLRGVAFVTGCAFMSQADPVMRDVAKPGDLDALGEMFGGEILMHMRTSAPRYGLVPWYVTTYKQACQEGWAPAPTNAYQKAIWDKVHAMPTEPIKIKPETKKVEK